METCLWCTEAAKSQEAVTVFLKDYCTGGLTKKEMQDANHDFIYCSDCVVEYHQARERVPSLHKHLWEMETARLLKFFQEMLEVDVDPDLYIVDDGHEEPISRFTPDEFNNQLRYPLIEVLKYPYLLCQRDLCELVIKVLCRMENMKNPLQVQEQYQGTYLLMVHPNKMVRRWAIATARSSGRVDRDKYYDLQEVFCCMFYVLDLGIPGHEYVPQSYFSGELPEFLPPHLYDANDKKSFWLGICMVLMQLDSQAMDNLLMGSSRQTNIPQCIINTMSDSNKDDQELDPFWPALQCFLVILDRLGSEIWGQLEPLNAFRAITNAGSYIAEIKNIRRQTSGTRVKMEPENHDDLLSCSQIVYDCYVPEQTSRSSDCSSSNADTSGNAIFEEMSCLLDILKSEMGQGMRVYGSTFLWFSPFVRSIMELSIPNTVCIGEVLHYLDNNIDKDVLYGQKQTCDKVTEFFIRILVDLISLHLTKGHMGTMSFFTHIWVDMVMQCATLSYDSCDTRIQAGGVGAMSRACKNLIHTLLMEAIRTGTGTVPEFPCFLNSIKLNMRGGRASEWELSKSEYENLKKCLLKIVKAIADRPAVSSDLPCAPPTPPLDPPENVICYPNSLPLQQVPTRDAKVGPGGPVYKEEPLWEDLECEGSFRDCRKEMIKVKNEPHNSSIPIPVVRPLELPKPDLGKMQEIRSRFNAKNFSRIQAIVDRKFETENEGKGIGLKELELASIVSPQPSTSQSNIPDSARISKSSKRKLINDDNEPLDVRRRRLKRSLKSREEDSSDAGQVSPQLSSTVKEVNKNSVITISSDDDDESSKDEKPLENGLRDNSFDLEFNKSPGRDYCDLSESQVFEFETQEDMASAWHEPQIDIPVVNKKQQLGNDSKACFSHDAVEPMDSHPISDEGIEKACLQVEAQIFEKQQPQITSASSMQVPPKQSSNEKCDFMESKRSKSPTGKIAVPDKGEHRLSRKPPVIEALSQKIKKPRRSHNAISQYPVEPCSSTMPTPSSALPSTTSHSRGYSASCVKRSPSTPAIVPPKKVRKPIEPKSAAELLGLKKKERKAFELSQCSLVSLGALRSYGQNVHVEPQQKSKRAQQKFGVKKGKKLLPSQDMQFLRQCRGRLQKSMLATALVAKSNKYPVPYTLPNSKPATETVEEQSDEEDDDSFLPCSQPDPDRMMDCKMGTEVSSVQNNEGAGGSMAKGAESCYEYCVDDEWISLTQNEPTDMELCSQMEEEYGENLFAGCVRMDNDSGNQSNSSEGEKSLPHKPLSCSTLQKSLPDASSETTSNDHVFLKPNIPTKCQKKAKPSTAKMYTSSSRNASLAKEMGKIANPLPAANTAKAKVARPPPAMQMPSPKSKPQEFHQPLPPRPTLHSTNQVSKPSLSNVPSAPHVPSYKTYPRPETPVSIQMPTVTQYQRLNNSQMIDPSYLRRAILNWEYSMFENHSMFGTPKDLCPFPLKKVPTTFSSCQEYFQVMYPLLLINVFEEMVKEWSKSRELTIPLSIEQIEYSNLLASAHFRANLSTEEERMQLYPKEDDLVLLSLLKNTGAYVDDETRHNTCSHHFGCVLKSKVNSKEGQHSTLQLTIQTRGNVSSVKEVRCQRIGSLIGTLREFRALCLLRNSKMAPPVLKPDIRFFAPCQDGLPNLDMPEYNRDQAKAINCGVAMVKRKEKTPKMLLIHGPPGTGKSKIIVGILDRLLSDRESPSVNRRTRILLCTQSNPAIDSLMKKIINTFKVKLLNIHAPQGTCGDINLVRLGSERISEDLKGFSLDSLVKKRLEKVQQKCGLDIQRRNKELDEIIEKLSRQCAETDKKSDMFHQLRAKKLSCLEERRKLGRNLNEFYRKRQEVQSRILVEAHVICCTLSTSGSIVLESAFRRLGHEPFNCVIVDEAGQAKETETLIPLLYRCQTLILVGDPEQLPPTVVSQTAKELDYDRSLMSRICKSLNHSNTRESPSIFLRFQYRMHPDICEFPAKYIYKNNLKSDRDTAQKLCSSSWPFEPYRVFDVIDGNERKEGESFINLKEVKLIMLLLKLFVEKHAMCKEKLMRVGIITHYKAQKLCIERALKDEPYKDYKKLLKLEVDTVDGFQGREMDCIIVSCVRASNENGSIGFLSKSQRMNVTITRAKFSLFILGHLRTLKMQEHWGKLIQDAEKRGTIISASESRFGEVTMKVLKRQLPRRYAHPPSQISVPGHPDRQEHRRHARPSDPRLPADFYASREQDRGNQYFTRPWPPSRGSDPRLHRSAALPTERHDEHQSSSSASSTAHRN